MAEKLVEKRIIEKKPEKSYLWIKIIQEMRQVILEIPDKKYNFIMELLKSFKYLKVEDTAITVPEEHKNIVRQRIKASKEDPSLLLNWDEVKNQFNL
jgi:hypothetical protein